MRSILDVIEFVTWCLAVGVRRRLGRPQTGERRGAK